MRECALITSVEDLEGLKVSHDFDGLDEGEARILTLKDSRILDNEGTSYFCVSWVCLTDGLLQRTSCRMSKWPKQNRPKSVTR